MTTENANNEDDEADDNDWEDNGSTGTNEHNDVDDEPNEPDGEPENELENMAQIPGVDKQQIPGVNEQPDNKTVNLTGVDNVDNDAVQLNAMEQATADVEADQQNRQLQLEAAMNECCGEHSKQARSLRPRHQLNYSYQHGHQHMQLVPHDYNHDHPVLESTVMTQHNMSKGVKMFGQAGVDAVQMELQQLHDQKVVLEPMNPDKMTHKEKQASLAYLMFLKQKRTGQIKGRGCTDGRKQ